MQRPLVSRVLAFVLLLTFILSAGWLTSRFARAAAPIYVRPGGDDTYCNGIADVDYAEGLTTCAVQTIQKGIDLVDAGGTVYVAAGTYAENVAVNKAVDLRGPNYGISPNTGTRVAEAVIVPGTSAIATGEILAVSASNVSINGFTIDGDNTSLTSGYLGTNGADIDAAEGVTVYFDNVNNLSVAKNVFKNLSFFGVTLFGNSYSAPATTGHLVDDNKFMHFGTYDTDSGIAKWGGGVLLYNNQYTRVTKNVMTNVRLGVQTGNFSRANTGTAMYQVIDGNSMQVRRLGIFHNLAYGPTSPYTLSNNSITGLADVNEVGVKGILLSSLSVPSTSQDNTIDLSGITAPTIGYEVWNVKSTSPATISGGSASKIGTGLFLNNYEGYSSDAADGAHASVSGLSISPNAGGTGIRVLDSPSSTTHANVQLAIGSGVAVTGGAKGLAVENTSASVTSVSDLVLSGQTGNYIELVSNAGNIDATGVSFDGQTGATATLAQNFAIEDMIVHKLDNSSLGLVRVKAAELFVTTNSGSIQRGIDVATAGDTVNVAAGTYDIASTILLNKAVTILGPTSGIAKLQGTNGGAVSIFEITASSVTIQNLEVTHNALPPFSQTPPWTELPNSLIRIPTGSALSGIAITNNKIYVPTQAGAMSAWNGVGITVGSAPVSGISITGNTIYNTRNGVVVHRGTIATINNNVIYNTKGGIMNYTSDQADADNRTMTGNAWGTTHNEWDIVWNSGTYYLPTDRTASVLGVSAANNGAYVLDRRAADAASSNTLTGNRSHIFVGAASSVIAPHPARGNFNEPFQNLDLAWQAVIPGGTVYVFQGGTYPVSAGTHPGGVVITANGITINLNGATVGAGSPAFTIEAEDVTIQGPGVLDGDGSTSPGILVNAGANNFTLKDVEVREWADGVEVAGNVTSFKLFDNWIHSNADAGLQVNSGVTLDGVVSIQGNLFKENGVGIRHEGTGTLPAEYNSWGHVTVPVTTVDFIGSIDADPWTFAEVYLDVYPDTEAIEREVNEDDTFDVALKVEAANLYGVTFSFTYDTDLLTLNTTTLVAPWDIRCTNLSVTPGIVTYRCNLLGEAEWNGGTVATLNFTANLPGVAPNLAGPWSAFFDISPLAADTNAAALNGARIYVNNAGFNAPSNPDRDITNTDEPYDGEIIITGLANFTGFVDLQGRPNDSGATISVYGAAGTGSPTLLAAATSAASGAFESSQQLYVGNTYYFQVNRPLYLPTTPMTATVWSNTGQLISRPLTALNTVVLLGGDATDDNKIDISDASCIGLQYGSMTPGFCNGGTTGWADVNGDGKVDLFDLVLMGGNFDKNSSLWIQN